MARHHAGWIDDAYLIDGGVFTFAQASNYFGTTPMMWHGEVASVLLAAVRAGILLTCLDGWVLAEPCEASLAAMRLLISAL